MKKESFIDLYEKEKDKGSLRKEAFFYFNDKYFKNPFKDYWIIEQQERFKAQKLKFFMPGRIYTYQYNPHSADILSFYDKRPMVYIIGQYTSASTGWNIVQGVNLNFLPETVKANFLDTTMNIFGKAYEEADKMSDDDKIASMKAISMMVTNWYFMSANFDKRAKIGLEFAVRNYDLARIIKPVLIEIEDFPMVPYFVPKEFAGKSPAYVYQLYLKQKGEIMKRSAINNKNQQAAVKAQKKFKKPGS